jgi:hypothetical protein
MADEFKWDIFISCAIEDQESVATPLAKELSKYSIKVWAGNSELRIGDSLTWEINEGITKSRYGVVILSPNFFAKKWTKRELEMLYMRDDEDKSVILPIWHEVTAEEVKSYNLMLADTVGISTSKGLDYVAYEIAQRLWLESNPKLKVFICHASENKKEATELYKRLSTQGYIDPWLDSEKLLPGQNWDSEIKKAVKESHAVTVLLSSKSISKEGYVQKEIRQILDVADEKPEDTIYIIPIKLEECNVPQRLQKWHWLYTLNDMGYEKLLHTLRLRAEQLKITP